MTTAPLPHDEAERLRTVHECEILDTPAEQEFDDLARLAAAVAGTPISLVSLVDAGRQWFKADVGLGVAQTPRDISFCGHTILGQDLFVVPDAARDGRFADNPLVTGNPHIRFYAGMPLLMPEGHAVGSLCVIDRVPRALTAEQAEALRVLGRQVVGQLQLRRTVRRLAASERRARSAAAANALLAAIVESSDDAIISKTLDGVITTWNRGAQRLFGWTAAEAVGRPVTILIPHDRLDEEPRILSKIRAGERVEHFETVRQTKDKRLIDVSATISPVRDEAGKVVGVSKVARDVTVQRRLQRELVAAKEAADRAAEQLQHTSRHDALTGLPNRVLFAERVTRCIALSRRAGQHFAVLFLDLDRFKVINDSLGHAAGDAVLTTIAARVKAALRPADMVAAGADRPSTGEAACDAGGWDAGSLHTVARLGGDEFTILLEQLRAPEDAARVAERVRAAVARPIEYGGIELTTTASIGIVTCRGGACEYPTAKDLLRDADAAMYKAKAAGKDRYVVFDRAIHDEAVRRMELEADLRRAVERGELELHYQPIVSLAHGRTVGFEALVRWRRGGKLVSPGDFIPVAEDTGLIVPIGEWVLRTACRQLAEWRAGGGPLADVYVTVNVSRRQLADGGLLATVRDVLRETGVPPAAVGLEITESAIAGDADAAEQTLSEIQRATDVRFLLDDFGTGQSSLACLRRFPISVLKIDRAFVRNVTSDARDAAVMRTILTLAHDLGMSVVAEGIESPEQSDFLAAAGCDLAQGYLFSKPLPAPAAGQFVTDTAEPLVALAA